MRKFVLSSITPRGDDLQSKDEETNELLKCTFEFSDVKLVLQQQQQRLLTSTLLETSVHK